ncbi:unnamed protein product [Ectocarpus fasciculatus]
MRPPGVNAYNCRNVLREVDNMADLIQLSKEQLWPLLGEGNASKLFKFFRQPAPVSWFAVFSFIFCRQPFKMTVVPNSSNIVKSCC